MKLKEVKGHYVPDEPSLIFPGVPSSCLRQTSETISRVSQEGSENAQQERLRKRQLEADKICD